MSEEIRTIRVIDAYALADKVRESMMNNPHKDDRVKANHKSEHEHFLWMICNAATINPEDLRPKGMWIPVHEHMWRKKEDGEIDEWAWDSEFHNGPVCVLCGATPCIHCTPGYKDTECYEESYRCSECSHHSREKEEFCAGCGADMRDGAKMEV